MANGKLVISIDFELYWGVRDKRSLDSYKQNLAGVHQAIPRTLELFDRLNIHATWATVGLLFCKNAAEVAQYMPAELPEYETSGLSPYEYLKSNTCLEPLYHFAPSLIELIASYDNQEIATHTFSHYYCREKGQTLSAFTADIQAALAISKEKGLDIRSIVFPRNQWNPEYLSALAKLGIKCYRGNESSWFYQAVDNKSDNILRRAGRLADTYFNISGHQTYALSQYTAHIPYNFPASRLLRPYSKKLAALEGLRLRRIQKSMLYAAQRGQIFHLWWHPHNFGVNTDQNIQFLTNVLQEYSILREKFGMQSATMAELCELTEQHHG